MIGHRHLNLNYLRNLSGGNNQFVVRMLQTFCNTIPPVIDLLSQSVESDDKEEIRKAAHKLKTMFRYVGADPVGDYLERMELGAETLSETETKKMLEYIRNSANETIAEAREVIITTPV